MNKKSSVGLMIAAMSVLNVSADNLSQRVDSLMKTRYGADEPGAAVVISKGDDILFEGYYGIADMATGQPVNAKTTFNIASVSKQFTVVGALMLQQRGLFDFDSPVARSFPEWNSRIWEEVTFRHLASQTSGVPDARDRSDREACVYADDSASVSYMAQLDTLKFSPGEYYDYINPTFIVIADAMSRAVGEPFVDFQSREIFSRCRMKHTYYFDPKSRNKHQSHAYIPNDNGGWREYDYGEETFFATRPDGGIYSTARDMALWEKALRDGLLIDQHLLARAYAPVVSVSDSPLCDYQRHPDTYYALGWFVDKTPGYPVKIYHTGDNGGYQAYVAKYPSCGVSVIVLENRNDCDRWQMALEIDRILKGEGLLSDAD